MQSLPGADQTLRSILDEVERILARLGVMYRVFGRAKSSASISQKITKKRYARGVRLLQDLVGVRIVVYFAEDCEIVRTAIKGRFAVESEMVDTPGAGEFGPRRLNIVLRVDSVLWNVQVGDLPIDATFELQIRTVLSEGWHEVEHDFRYKCADDWQFAVDKRRMLNGTLAALETTEWAMASLFEELAYHHYRAKRWEPMLRHKFRLRLQDASTLNENICTILNGEQDIAKRIWRADRSRFIERIAALGIEIPWTFDNLVHLVCAVEGIQHSPLANLRTKYIARRIDECFVVR